MKKFFALAAVAMLTASSASAHVPEGMIFGAWNWPTSHLPNLDGDISEWNVLPDELWLEINPDLFAVDDGSGKPVDTSDLWFRFAMGWNDELDRIYYVFDRFDNNWDRDAGGVGCCGQDDSVEVGLDSDHSGDWFWQQEGQSEEEQLRTRGRQAQTGHYRWPALEPFGWYWFWMSTSDWHDEEPYSCCTDSFTLDGVHGSEATIQAEWYTVGWDDFNFAGPGESLQHDFVEGEIIGAGLQVVDNDNGTEEDPKTWKWVLGGQADIFGNASSFSDFILLPVDDANLPSAVENDSWGQIKASIAQ
jgi:hypothetical protein